MTHQIQRQYIQVDLAGTENEGFALQNRLSDLCNEWLNPAIERVLDRCAPPDGRLCIDRLEVDAGTLPLENFESVLTETVVQALEKALLEKIPPGAAFTSPGSTDDANTRLKNDRQTAAEAFLYFLETGRLPWSFRLPSGVSLEEFLIDTWKTGTGKPVGTVSLDFSNALPRASLLRVLSTPQARRRLVLQFSGPFLQGLLQQISPEAYVSVTRILEAIRAGSAVSQADSAMLAVFEKQVLETAFAQVIQASSVNDTVLIAIVLATKPEVISAALPALKNILRPAVLPEFVRQLTTHSGPAFPTLAPLLEGALKALSGPLSTEIQSIIKKEAAHSRSDKPRRTQKGSAASPATDVIKGQGDASGDPLDAAGVPEDDIYVDNAGLIILHPFLQMFFENIGVARAGALVEPARALHLLHFLCTGQGPAPEYELVLPKILCNIPLEEPVISDIVLTDKEKEESTALLESAIRWWEALRSTSPDALRGTFLCRPGKLSVRGDGDWLLQVERQSFDILLDQLPWGISVVKLPWMERMIWVEWA